MRGMHSCIHAATHARDHTRGWFASDTDGKWTSIAYASDMLHMHRCSCHDRPISLLYKGFHEVWYSSETVFRGSWLDGNWHGRGQWVVGRKMYLGHWVCGLFTAIMSFQVVCVCGPSPC